MRQVSMREANQNFSAYVAEVETGEQLVVLRRGKPVAEIKPYSGPVTEGEDHGAALGDLQAMFNKGLDLKGLRIVREEVYERGR